MKCPYCAHLGDKVVDSRESKEGEVIRRRRECLDCGKRFTSYERIDEIPYMVVKKDGTRERFDRAEADRRPAEGVREAAGQRRRARSGRRPRRGDAAGAAGKGDRDRRRRRVRDGGAEEARQGRLRPLRLGLSAFPRHRRVRRRAQAAAEPEGMTDGNSDRNCKVKSAFTVRVENQSSDGQSFESGRLDVLSLFSSTWSRLEAGDLQVILGGRVQRRRRDQPDDFAFQHRRRRSARPRA